MNKINKAFEDGRHDERDHWNETLNFLAERGFFKPIVNKIILEREEWHWLDLQSLIEEV